MPHITEDCQENWCQPKESQEHCELKNCWQHGKELFILEIFGKARQILLPYSSKLAKSLPTQKRRICAAQDDIDLKQTGRSG